VRRLALVLLLLTAVATAASDSTFSIDKAEHVVVSAGVAGLVYVGAARVLPHWPALAVAAGSTMAAALGKEWWDTKHDSHWSWKDLAADATGVLLTAAITTAVRSWGRRHSPRALPAPAVRRQLSSRITARRMVAAAGIG
jgi:uncharacterized protein YfiM (DUF2279 family)